MDLLGHGLSRAGRAKDKIDASLLHIEAIIKTEGYERAHFIGVSMGTLIAQYFALFHPDRVLSMTILGGYDINADNKEIAKAQRAEGLKWIVKAIFSMDSFRKYVASVSVLRREEQARFHEMARSFTRKSFLVMSGLGKVLQIREGCKRDYPLLILCGDSDIELSRRMSERWHRSQPGSKFCVIRDAGHCANMDNPGAFNETVMAFIEGNS
jgi:pimeloyl-ACP methyl ester carboxylesterase